jgi:hypothetical protein
MKSYILTIKLNLFPFERVLMDIKFIGDVMNHMVVSQHGRSMLMYQIVNVKFS